MSAALLISMMATATGLPVGGLVARQIFGRLAVSAACRDAFSDVETFKQHNTFIRPLSGKFRDVATIFHDMLDGYTTKREREMDVLRAYRIPKPQISMDLNDLSEPKIDNIELFVTKMVSSGKRKFKRTLLKTLKNAVRQAKLEEMTAAAVAGGAALDPDGKISAEGLTQFDVHFREEYKKVLKHLEPELNKIEEIFRDVAKETGIADVSVEFTDNLHHMGAHVLGQQAADHLSSAFGHAADLYGVATLHKLARTSYYEYQMLQKGETDILHSVTEGGLGVALKAAAVGIGIATGVGLIGIIGFSIASGMLNHGVLKELNKDREDRYNEILNQIRAAFRAARDLIDAIAKEFDDEFQRRVELYPDINDEPVLNDWLDRFVEAFGSGLIEAEATMAKNLESAISKIPENNRIDSLLGIDRREAVANLYRRAQREISNRHASTAYAFTNARDSHSIDALAFLRDHFVFTSAETMALLDRMDPVAEDTDSQYSQRYEGWYTDITEFKDVEGGKATEKMMVEARGYNAFKAARVPEMNALVGKINATRKRMGIKETPQPAG